MRDTILKGGFVVSVDPDIGNRGDTDVLIRDGKIQAIDSNLEVTDAEVVDASDCIVMPGIVDGHRHIWQGAMRGVCADWSLMDYVSGIRMNAATAYSPDDMYAAQFHGGLEALNAGVTTITDYCHNILTPDHAHEAIRGLKDSGLRTIWNYGFNFPPQPAPHFTSLNDRVEFARTLAAQYFSSTDQLVTMGVAPEERGFWTTPDIGKAQFELARELNARIFWHANGGEENGEMPQDIKALHELGLLGPDVVGVHMHATQAEEWKMLADAGGAVAFTPDTELQMGMKWSSTEIARRYGIPQSYGADIISNNNGDMFTQLRLGLQAARARAIDEEGVYMTGVPFTCADALRWGTLEGAKALGLDHAIGSLTPGKLADMVMLRADSLTMVGWDKSNPASLILQAQSSDVDSVLVGGTFVKRDGKMTGNVVNACRLLEEANHRIHNIVKDRGGFLLDPEEFMNRALAIQSSEHGQYPA
jgi:5-methylthioadenosine/S-adenosylhomocysteine deaminase